MNGKSTYAIDELKIWDSDVTTFRSAAAYHDVSYVYDGTPHTLQPATGTVGGEVFRYSLSEEGPFAEEMPTLTAAGSVRIWYEVEADGETTRSSATVTVAKLPVKFTSASAEKQYDGSPLAASDVAVAGTVPDGEGFSFSVTGSQTAVGESDNAFTWTPNEGTNPDNYEVTAEFGKLKVLVGPVADGTEYELVKDSSRNDAMRVTRLPCPDGGDVVLPGSMGGVPVAEIAAGALAGTGVTGVRVPEGVTVSGALFENLAQVTNVSFDAGSAVAGALSFRGCAALQEVVVPASVTELAPYAFLGCWALERVVFCGEPPFGNDTADTDALSLLTASVRPASLLQMADMICYPADSTAKWEKSLRNLGYGGKYGAYNGEWTGPDALVADSGNLGQNIVPMAEDITNMVVSIIADVLASADPAEQPSAHYSAQAGHASGTLLAGAAGWDAFGIPDGMTWDKETGMLGGAPERSGTYDVILVSGSGAETRMMRTTIDVAGYAVTTGYMGVAFSASGVPWDSLESYKVAPSGLSWKNKVLSGVPKKAGTTRYQTVSGEPVVVEILALPAGAVGAFDGILSDDAGSRYPLKFSATAAGKLSATVTKGTKSYSLSAARWSRAAVEVVNGVPHRMFYATLSSSGISLSVTVDADAAWNADALTASGTLGAAEGLEGSAQRNAFAEGGAAAAAALAGTRSFEAADDGNGGWTLDPAPDGAKGPLTVVLKDTGAAVLSGTLPNKKRVNASSTLHVDAEGSASVRFYVGGAWIVWLPPLP